jgi:predicted O-methyltransferase YrrM
MARRALYNGQPAVVKPPGRREHMGAPEAFRYAMDERALAVARACKGFLDEEEGLRLHALAREHAQLGPILEIGSYCGKSSVYLGSGARAAGGTLICVDHHRGNEEQQPGEEYHDPDLLDPVAGALETLPALRRTLRAADLESTAILVVAPSRIAARFWRVPLGLVFIDGGHSSEAAHGDYESWAPLVVRGGILAIHDLFPDPTQGGQPPIEVYRRALASGEFEELPTTKTLGVLRRR